MKKYKDVVRERYNKEDKISSKYDEIYSMMNNIGLQMKMKFTEEICNIFKFLKSKNIDFAQCKILDVGCGNGALLRTIAEIKENSDNLYGYDLSEYRIKQAENLNPNIKYNIGDITNFKINDKKFDIIFAVNVFMHLNTIEEIENSLKNIKDMLNENGVFIWYDAYYDNHFNAPDNSDSCGFNPNEMDEYSRKVGLDKIYYNTLYKYLDNNINYSTAYMGNKFPLWFIEMMEEKIPGLPVNVVMIFKKSDSYSEINNENLNKIKELKEAVEDAIKYIEFNIESEQKDTVLGLIRDCKQAILVIKKLKNCDIEYLLDDIILLENIVLSGNTRGINKIIKMFYEDFNNFL